MVAWLDTASLWVDAQSRLQTQTTEVPDGPIRPGLAQRRQARCAHHGQRPGPTERRHRRDVGAVACGDPTRRRRPRRTRRSRDRGGQGLLRRGRPECAGRRGRRSSRAEIVTALRRFHGSCNLPTIAAVNGAAVGAGLNLALAADVRIAGPAALFDARFQKLGLHPGGGATWMLQRAVGPQVARAALLFGMCFDAESAVRHGLALMVADDPVTAALELAAGPAAAPREVVLASKATMRATASPGSLDLEQHELAKRLELGPQAKSVQSPEFAARLAAAQHR